MWRSTAAIAAMTSAFSLRHSGATLECGRGSKQPRLEPVELVDEEGDGLRRVGRARSDGNGGKNWSRSAPIAR